MYFLVFTALVHPFLFFNNQIQEVLFSPMFAFSMSNAAIDQWEKEAGLFIGQVVFTSFFPKLNK